MRVQGEALVAAGRGGERGLDSIEVPDWSRVDPEGRPQSLVITLNPGKTVAENAEEIFKRLRKGRRTAETLTPLISSAETELAALEADLAWVSSLPATYTDSRLSALHTRLCPAPRPRPTLPAQQGTSKYGRGITVSHSPSGYEVVAGRSADANERVSFELAKPSDMWFHVAGTAGSHVLLRCSVDHATPEDVQYAAIQAARYSSVRHNHSVEVGYTAARSLTRPPAFMRKPGLVLVMGRQRTVRVDPRQTESQ